MPTPLSETAKALIAKARIVSFATWTGRYSPATLERLQAADDHQCYLTDADLEAMLADWSLLVGTDGSEIRDNISIVKQLRDQATAIVDEARMSVLQAFPQITEPGGGLYPAERAEACWRDFWQFLRCITYGIAGETLEYTSVEGLHYMELLYRELQVPLDAMVFGLEALKTASLSRLPAEQQPTMAPYFDHLIQSLQSFLRSQV